MTKLYVKTSGENFIRIEMFSRIPYSDHTKPDFSAKRSALKAALLNCNLLCSW